MTTRQQYLLCALTCALFAGLTLLLHAHYPSIKYSVLGNIVFGFGLTFWSSCTCAFIVAACRVRTK